MKLSTRLVAVLAVPMAVVFLAACSDAATESQGQETANTSAPVIEGEPAGFNADDVAFVTNMIPHHEQAVELAALVPDRSSNPDVVDIAARISAAQEPEIEAMKVFLVQWQHGGAGEGDSDAGHGGHGAHMQGMVDEATMTRLESLSGAEFDTLWLESMIGHHQGAIEMAKAEIANGENVDAVAMAKTIAETQQAEIDQMNHMLGG